MTTPAPTSLHPSRASGRSSLLASTRCDTPDPQAFLAGSAGADFVLALETRTTPVTELADVVLPVGVITEKSGTLVDWEGRARPFGRVMPQTVAITDARALALVARAMGRSMGSIEVADLRAELAGMGRWQGPRPDADLAEEPAAGTRTRSGGPVHVAAPARRGRAPARRAQPRRHGPTRAGPCQCRDCCRDRRGRWPAGHDRLRDRSDHPAAGRSPTWSTVWCGCRATRSAARSTSISGSAPVRQSGSAQEVPNERDIRGGSHRVPALRPGPVVAGPASRSSDSSSVWSCSCCSRSGASVASSPG